MSIKKTLWRVGVVLSVVAMVALVGCTDEGNSTGGGGSYNNDPVTINGLTWTKNININTPDSWCYEDNGSNCTKYGRLYTYEAAKSVCANMGGRWRLPTREDWDNLVTYAGGSSTAGKKLKAKSGWNSNGNGTDDYGFSALPGGIRFSDGSFGNVGYYGSWWCATENDGGGAYYRHMGYDLDGTGENSYSRSDGFSVRCVGDA